MTLLRSMTLVLLAVAPALGAAAARLEIAPAGRRATPAGAWALPSAGEATAPGHELAARVTLGPGAVLEVMLADGSTARFVPLSIAARGVPSAVPAALPAAKARLHVGEAGGIHLRDEILFVAETFAGVDEVFTLGSGEVKHDLLVHGAALRALGGGDIVASWALELAPGVVAVEGVAGEFEFRDGASGFLGKLPAPLVADADDTHWSAGVARLEITGAPGQQVLALVVPQAWAFDPARALPLRLDPTVSIQPASSAETGWVDETGTRLTGAINSGSLSLVGFGSDVRGYSEFDTSGIPDAATITDVRLQVWLSNHDNPGDIAVPLRTEVKHVAARASATPAALHAAIGPLFGGRLYLFENVPNTGPDFCPASYVFRDYDLGPLADADLAAQLPQDFFTVGFTSQIVTDPLFDHIDYIGFPEVVNNPFGCPTTDFPGTRITLVVSYVTNTPPVCDAGGPYAPECPRGPVTIDGSGSSDADGDVLTFAWSTDCPGSLADATAAITTLDLDGGCAVDCTVTLAVSDGVSTVSCSRPVSARDVTPPVIVSSNLAALCLWPPRHDMFCLGLPSDHVVARDACQPDVIMRWTGCVSDQPDEAREPGRPENGDGHFARDCQLNPDGTLCVRVERAGSDPVAGRNTFDGRRYGVSIEVDDGCGNIVTTSGTLHVPHDRRGGSGGQDDPCQRGNKQK